MAAAISITKQDPPKGFTSWYDLFKLIGGHNIFLAGLDESIDLGEYQDGLVIEVKVAVQQAMMELEEKVLTI